MRILPCTNFPTERYWSEFRCDEFNEFLASLYFVLKTSSWMFRILNATHWRLFWWRPLLHAIMMMSRLVVSNRSAAQLEYFLVWGFVDLELLPCLNQPRYRIYCVNQTINRVEMLGSHGRERRRPRCWNTYLKTYCRYALRDCFMVFDTASRYSNR